MKNILVLVDFTDTATISVEQAIVLAKAKGAALHLCHVFPTGKLDEGLATNPFDDYMQRAESEGVACNLAAAEGDLIHEAQAKVKEVNADLVVVCTHGKHGIKQNIFGSHIYNLVKRIPVPTMVVSDATEVKESGFKRIMMPVGSHENYINEVKQACAVAAHDATVVIFAIIKPGIPLQDSIQKNVELAKKELESAGVAHEYLEIDSGIYSIGYSHETLEYMKGRDMDLIVIMTEVSDVNRHFGKIDKENVILNDLGVPVLCAT